MRLVLIDWYETTFFFFSVAMYGGSLYGSLVLDEKEERSFDRFNFLFGEFFVSFLLSSKFKRIY